MSDLDDELVRYRTVAFLLRGAKERAIGNPSAQYVSDLGIPALKKAKPDRLAAIKEYFDSVEESLFDQYLLLMVAAFERLAYEKLKNAVGAARATISQHYPAPSSFSRAAQRLAKDVDDFRNLADIEVLLASYPQSQSKDLQALREHRNWIAHGKRLGHQSLFSKMEDVHRTLEDILSVIER
ncbi:MAG: hypothetical protein ABSF26_08280 [Thermoguttaceae bacterium]|jgi:hypothetical protein